MDFSKAEYIENSEGEIKVSDKKVGDKKMATQISRNTRVGFMSRIDYCGSGFRLGMVTTGRERLDAAKTHFDVLLGGLVCGPDVEARVRKAVRTARTAWKTQNSELPVKERSKFIPNPIIDEELGQIAKELASILPRRKRSDGKGWVKLYIMVSTISHLDGQYGQRIAELLASLRAEDIRFWTNPDEHFPLEPTPHPNFSNIACLVPVSTQFKSRYDSSSIDYVIEDYLNRGKEPAELIVVGCVGSHFYKPKGGESGQHYFSLPLLHKPQFKKRAPENQVGVVIAEITTEGELLVTNENFNDLVVAERSMISVSEHFSEREKKLLDLFQSRSWWTCGLIDDHMGRSIGLDQDGIDKALQGIVKKCATRRLQPTLLYDDSSKRYYIDSSWLQRNLKYPWPTSGIVVDRFLAFACLHALSRKSDLASFINDASKIMLKYNIATLVGAGDFIEGCEHTLAKDGSIIAGANYSQQEEVAAKTVAEVLLRVFDVRFAKMASNVKMKNSKDVLALIDAALPNFHYRPGNHDEWLHRHGVGVLQIFEYTLHDRLRRGIVAHLSKRNLPSISGIDELLDSKVIQSNSFMIESGLDVRLDHLHKGGSSTKTLNNQILLKSRKEKILIHGNFHIANSQTRYNYATGQRIVTQVPTTKRDHSDDSDFESNKGKLLDSGLSFFAVYSKNGRIIRTTSIFFSFVGEFIPFNNQNVIESYSTNIGIRRI